MQLMPTHPNQMHFDFVPVLEIRLRRHLWQKNQSPNSLQSVKSIFPTNPFKRQRKKVLVSLPKEPVHIQQSLDLFYELSQELANDQWDKEDDPNVEIAFTENEVYQLHGMLLHDAITTMEAELEKQTSLDCSNSYVPDDDIRDILHWIFSPPIPDRVTRIINNQRVTTDIPFTYGFCCRLFRFDADEQRYRYDPLWLRFKRTMNAALHQRYRVNQ